MHFGLPQRIIRLLCGYFEHQRSVFFQGCAADPLQTVAHVYPQTKLNVHVHYMKIHDWVEIQKSCRQSRKVVSKLQKCHPRSKVEVLADRRRKRRREEAHCVEQIKYSVCVKEKPVNWDQKSNQEEKGHVHTKTNKERTHDVRYQQSVTDGGGTWKRVEL